MPGFYRAGRDATIHDMTQVSYCNFELSRHREAGVLPSGAGAAASRVVSATAICCFTAWFSAMADASIASSSSAAADDDFLFLFLLFLPIACVRVQMNF